MSHLRCAFAALLISLPLMLTMILPTKQQLTERRGMNSIQIVDRHGTVLREILSRRDATSRYVVLDEISPWLQQATLVGEDKRFFFHPGIDVLAIARSIFLNLQHGDIVTGGSTITQQLARNMLGSPPRTLVTKIIEACVALNIELKLSKPEILELYFNCAPYANQAYGIEAAAQLYFGKPSRDLSLAEAAYLAGLPRAPSMLDPYRYPDRALEQQHRILAELLECGIIDTQTYHDARSQPVILLPKENSFNAPHFCASILNDPDIRSLTPQVIRTTLDLPLQKRIEDILSNNIERLTGANATNAAAIVLDVRTMEVLAYMGSVDFFDVSIDGEVDGVSSLRQPGSALKPFMYAIALSNGATAATLLPDLPTHARTSGGDYTPRNYDEKYHGFVRLRTALACSYNIPAVRICEVYGPDLLLITLRKLGFRSLDKSPVHYGLGLTLGNGEVTLLELTRAFATFARGGQYMPERLFINSENSLAHGQSAQVFDGTVSYIISDILSDNSARSPAFGEYSPLNLPFFCAAKTGTSKDFRDNWCIGFTDAYVVGVWVGNFDGSPMNGVSGISGAGPIFRDIMLLLHQTRASRILPRPDDIIRCTVCSVSGLIASQDCEQALDEFFIRGTEPRTTCRHENHSRYNTYAEDIRNIMEHDRPLYIAFPDDGDIFKIDPVLRREYQQVSLQVHSKDPLKSATWYVDETLIARVDAPYTIRWRLEPGYHDIRVHAVASDDQKLGDTIRILVLR
ncbi:MAG: penicillin-binding protein 1C [candidate division WOR-3 bacterium]|nr:MAG: penicillin-binding protein 1C [candidate division WOR-3 bacterium]